MSILKTFLKRSLYLLGYWVVYLVALIAFRIQIHGRDNIPEAEELLVISRHESYWDPPLIGLAMGPTNMVHFIARQSLVKNPLFAVPVRLFSTLINRDNFGKRDLRKLLKVLREKQMVCILPEGTTKPVNEPKKGALKLAEKMNKILLPVKLSGGYPPRWPRICPRLHIHIGQPFTIQNLRDELEQSGEVSPGNDYDKLSRLMMDRIDTVH